jgi:hypothetical protein
MQLELFTPTPFYFAMTITSNQRLELYKSDFGLYNQMRLTRQQVAQQVARAMFIAKVEGFEFSRYPRR